MSEIGNFGNQWQVGNSTGKTFQKHCPLKVFFIVDDTRVAIVDGSEFHKRIGLIRDGSNQLSNGRTITHDTIKVVRCASGMHNGPGNLRQHSTRPDQIAAWSGFVAERFFCCRWSRITLDTPEPLDGKVDNMMSRPPATD